MSNIVQFRSAADRIQRPVEIRFAVTDEVIRYVVTRILQGADIEVSQYNPGVIFCNHWEADDLLDDLYDHVCLVREKAA